MRAVADSCSGYERDFMKQTMLEHEAVFKNQVNELHRLYRIQRSLVDEVKGKNFTEECDNTSEIESRRKLPVFLLPNLTDNEGSSSQACNGRLQNGVGSKDGGVFEVRPVKVRRTTIDLQLPADEYLDTDETGDTDEITVCPPYKRSESGRGAASHQSNFSGSCLDLKNSNCLADLNEPFKCRESEPLAMSRGMYSHYGRNNADVQSHWLEKNTSLNGWMVLEGGHNRSTQRDQLHLPSHSGQVLSNRAYQPQSYSTTDHSKVKFSGKKVRSMNPQVSYDSYMESSVKSNPPRLHNDYRSDFVRPWSHWSSSWENPMSSSYQRPYPVQTNPFMNFVTHSRTDSSFETGSRVSNGFYQGFSSGSQEAVLNLSSAGYRPNVSLSEVKHQSFENLQGPNKQECSAGLPWLKPKPSYRTEIANAFFDLNASTNQVMDDTYTGDVLNSVSSQKGLRSALCSNNANMGRFEVINPMSSRKVMVKRNLNINLPCEASGSVDHHGAKAFCVEKKEENKAANFRHYIDLNSCASEDEDFNLHSSLRVKTTGTSLIDLEAPPTLESEEEGESSLQKTNQETWGLMKDGNSVNELVTIAAQAIVAISLADHQCHPNDAGSSSTDVPAKSTLSWFAEIITSCGLEFERKVVGSIKATISKGNQEEYSSGEIDYFEAMTLNLHETKEEDYMPKPLVPEKLKLEGTSYNRPRRGQARRGRPKRDFQRDILPGISSLLRHEVTEDIQMLGRLTQTRDYTWNPVGVAARRNPKRKRLVTNISQAPVCESMAQPMNESLSVVELADSKLTGWGKATRRPRRQRCPPAGNPTTVSKTLKHYREYNQSRYRFMLIGFTYVGVLYKMGQK
ncbi:unnamed protein product [Cochlearia groenlandica]